MIRTFFAFTLLLAICSIAAAQTRPADGDLVEMFTGQTLHGTLLDSLLSITTRLGSFSVTTAQLFSLSNDPNSQSGLTVVTTGGDVLVGRAGAESLRLATPDGGVITLPAVQIKSVTRPLGAASTQPAQLADHSATVTDMDGDSLAVEAPASISFRTRWGLLSLKPEQVRQIVFSDNNQAAHRITLSDGSTFAGVLEIQSLSLTPKNLHSPALDLPVGELARLSFGTASSKEALAKLDLIGGDTLRGAIEGNLNIGTQFGDVSIAAAEVNNISLAPDTHGDWLVTRNDAPPLQGSAPRDAIAVRLACGVSLNVPADMIVGYVRSAPSGASSTSGTASPAPTDEVDANIAALVSQLSVGSAVIRTRAQKQLVQLGAKAIPSLLRLRPNVPQAVQGRIDTVVAQIQQAGN